MIRRRPSTTTVIFGKRCSAILFLALRAMASSSCLVALSGAAAIRSSLFNSVYQTVRSGVLLNSIIASR